MIDITKIQPFDVPPEITALKNENIHLTKENKSLLKQTNIIIGVIVFSLLFGMLFINLKKMKMNIQQKIFDDYKKEIFENIPNHPVVKKIKIAIIIIGSVYAFGFTCKILNFSLKHYLEFKSTLN